MIHLYFLGAEAFVILGYLLGIALFPKRYPLVFYKFFGIISFMVTLWYAAMFTHKSWMDLIPWVLGGLTTVACVLIYIFRNRITLISQREIIKFIGLEIISYMVYLLWAYIRTYKPDILGTEKLMDVALINTILKQGVLPIENPWLSGFLMNYYYFGHFMLAVLQYIFSIPTAIGYNLAISLLGVWILQAGFLVTKKLRINDLGALLISGIMAFGGNLYLTIQSGIAVSKTLSDGVGAFVNAILHSTSMIPWFASATRVIPYTINEYPSYSVILGDLHGHYLSYAFFLIGIFIILDIFFPEEEDGKKLLTGKSLFLGLLLGALYLTNSWDVLTLAILAAGSAAIIGYKKYSHSQKDLVDWGKIIALFCALPVIALSIPQFLYSTTYYLPPVGGVGINNVFSNPFDIFQLFGQFFIIAAMGGFMVWHAVNKSKFIKNWKTPSVILPLLFLAVAFVLVLSVEFFYAKDVFSTLNPPYSRTNTVFKIYYHAWSFWCLGSLGLFFAALPQYLLHAKTYKWMYAFQVLFVLVIAVVMSFPFTSTEQYLMPKNTKFSINRLIDDSWTNGYAYIAAQHPPDYEIIEFLNQKPIARILESVTYDSYSYYARISAYTGMPAVTGWPLHNVQWYDGYDGKGLLLGSRKLEPMKVADRMTDVEIMYTSTNKEQVQALLKKYDVTYVIFGAQEDVWATAKKKDLNRSVYDSLCTVAWSQNTSVVYQCRQ